MLFDVTTILLFLDGLLQVSALCTPPPGLQIVISSQIDSDVLSLCDTIDGSVYIDAHGPINLDGVRNITGSLSAGGEVSAIIGNTLASIGGVLSLQGLTSLETVTFPNLLSVGSLFLSPPNLRTLDFGEGLQNISGIQVEGRLKRIFVINNTALPLLEGLEFPSVDELIIENNANLGSTTFGLDTLGLAKISGNGYDNGNETSFSCPFLTTIDGDVSLKNLRDINLPRLAIVNGGLYVDSNVISDFNTESLISVSGTLSLQRNEFLQNISAPMLRNITELMIQDNPNLQIINGLDSLAKANTITLTGNQTSVLLSNLTSVENFDLESSDDKIDCKVFDNLRCRGIIKGEYQCEGKTVAIAKLSSSCTSSSNSSKGLTLREKLAISFGVIFGVLILAALIYLLFWLIQSRGLGRPTEEAEDTIRRIDSNVSEMWFDSNMDADTRYVYINGNRVVDRATPVMNEQDPDAGYWEVVAL